MRASELRNEDEAALQRRIAEAKQEMFTMRMQVATGRPTNTARFRQLRKDIARAMTILGERQRGQ